MNGPRPGTAVAQLGGTGAPSSTTGGAPISPTSTSTKSVAAGDGGKPPSSRSVLPPPGPKANLAQPTAGRATQPKVTGTTQGSSVDPAKPVQPGPTSEQPSSLQRAGDTFKKIGEQLESPEARIASTAICLGAAATIPVLGNIIAITRGCMHLLGFLGSLIIGPPNFTHLFQGLIEFFLGSFFIAPMAAPAGMLIGEMAIPYLFGTGRPAEILNFGNRPPAPRS
ncbi:MAG: hypothetical protein H7Z43_02995 [Clostridia bacterium]|nr:hypothetical protein [Deltaproteobacteria bacterium]